MPRSPPLGLRVVAGVVALLGGVCAHAGEPGDTTPPDPLAWPIRMPAFGGPASAQVRLDAAMVGNGDGGYGPNTWLELSLRYPILRVVELWGALPVCSLLNAQRFRLYGPDLCNVAIGARGVFSRRWTTRHLRIGFGAGVALPTAPGNVRLHGAQMVSAPDIYAASATSQRVELDAQLLAAGWFVQLHGGAVHTDLGRFDETLYLQLGLSAGARLSPRARIAGEMVWLPERPDLEALDRAYGVSVQVDFGRITSRLAGWISNASNEHGPLLTLDVTAFR